MSTNRGDWNFGYEPVATAAGDDDGTACDMVIATPLHGSLATISKALKPLLPTLHLETVLSHAPLFWTRVRATDAVRRAQVRGALSASKIPFRYVASARRSDLTLPPTLNFGAAQTARPDRWRARPAGSIEAVDARDGLWFMRDEDRGGIAVDRRLCGTGVGTRLAIVEDDAEGLEEGDLDAIVTVGVEQAPRVTAHGALMTGWAVGLHRQSVDGQRIFTGVAPEASPRLYCIPKPSIDTVSLPRAIVQATVDGADVIVAATYVEGSTSPMLDDALEFATRLGRRGRGTAVVIPTGRETSSPPQSVHASLSLGLGEPASDPRVFCVAPSSREGGWFCYRDRKGRFRPFANRGPAVRWMAPGDDITDPLLNNDRLHHAESSGAAAICAGALLLILANNPLLRLSELDAVVTLTATSKSWLPQEASFVPLADPQDVCPPSRDRDGHNARWGYGRIHALRACLVACDPVASALARIGEEDAARAYVDLRRSGGPLSFVYTPKFARWCARALLHDARVDHLARVFVRHARLVAHAPHRYRAHGEQALVRMVGQFLRLLASPIHGPPRTRSVSHELESLAAQVSDYARNVELISESADGDNIVSPLQRLIDSLWRHEATNVSFQDQHESHLLG